MSNIQVNNGQSTSISGISTTNTSLAIKESSINVSIAKLGGDKNYVHSQDSPSASWTVTHNLNKRASVSVVDSAGTVIICDVDYISDNQVVLNFDSSTSGNAYLN